MRLLAPSGYAHLETIVGSIHDRRSRMIRMVERSSCIRDRDERVRGGRELIRYVFGNMNPHSSILILLQ